MTFDEWRATYVSMDVYAVEAAYWAWEAAESGVKELRQLLQDTAEVLEKVGGQQGHGSSYSARELHADLFARIDQVVLKK